MQVAPSRYARSPFGLRSRLAIFLTGQYAIGGAFLPFLTLFLRDRGLSFKQIALLQVCMAVTNATIPIVWGLLADSLVAANRLISFLHLVGAGALSFLAAQGSFPGIIAGIVLWFAFAGSTNALSNAVCYHNLERPKEEFGAVRSFGSIGWVLPSLAIWCWLHGSPDGDLTFVLRLAALLEALMVCLAVVLPLTPPPARERAGRALAADPAAQCGPAPSAEPLPAPASPPLPASASAPFHQAARELLLRPSFVLLLAIAFLMSWSFSIVFYFSPPHLENCGVLREWIGPIQSLAPLVEAPLLLFLPLVLRRLGDFRTLMLGCLLLLLRQAVYVSTPDPTFLIGSYAVVGGGIVYYLITISLVVDHMTGRRVRATAQVLLMMATSGLGPLVGHWVSGGVAERSPGDLTAVFALACGVNALAVGIVPLVPWLERRRRHHARAGA